MKKFLYSHPNIIIGAFAVVFIGTLIFFYSWAIDGTFSQIPRALIPPAPQSITGFDISGASKLGLGGLVNGAPSPAPSLPTSPSSSATASPTP
jgi:hypothetical protein